MGQLLHVVTQSQLHQAILKNVECNRAFLVVDYVSVAHFRLSRMTPKLPNLDLTLPRRHGATALCL